MNLQDIQDFDELSDDELYKVLDENRDTWKMLHEEGVLERHKAWEPVRRRCVTSLYFLSRFTWDSNPFGGPDIPLEDNLMTHENHDRVIDMFVKKVPGKRLAELDEFKTFLTLYPRGSLKSSWGIQDIVQWVLYDFKIRVLVLSAADDLANQIVDEARGYFKVKEPEPTLMNMFWKEHCLLEKDFPESGTYTSPAWLAKQIDRREPTLMSKGATGALSGFHFDVVQGDDVVETRNSSETQCVEVRKKFGITRKTLLKHGYLLLRGTRYHDEDLYGEIISKAEVGEFDSKNFSITEKKIINQSRKTKILIGAAMTIKPEAEMELAKYNIPRNLWFRKAGPDGVVLLMPKVPAMSYDVLLVDYEDNPEAFETQMRQNVLPPTQQMFTRELIVKQTVNWMDIPPLGRVTQTWDLNGGKGRANNDLCVGSTALWDPNGIGYIIDLVAHNYPTPVAIARAVVNFACRHHPEVISIEDSPGVRMLEPTIIMEADKTNDEYVKALVRRLYYRKVDTSKDAKKNRISALFPLVLYGRFKFSTGLPEREKMIEQFIKPITKNSKNDIPDCISFQRDFLPIAPMTEEEKKKYEEMQKLRKEVEIDQARQKSTWLQLYEENQGINYYPEPIYEMPKDDEVFTSQPAYNSEDGLDNILGTGLIG